MPPEYERRHVDSEIRERLAAIETASRITKDEVTALRVKTHELGTHTATLNLMAEEARDSRESLGVKMDALTNKIDPMMVAVAQGATTIAMHVQQCTELNRVQDQRHAENHARLSRMERTIWMATGAAFLLSSMITVAVTIGLSVWKN